MVPTAVHARASAPPRTGVVTRTRKVAVLLGTHRSALRVSSSRSSRDRSPMVAATSMRAPTATPTSRGAPGASFAGASARASRVGASSARRPVAARAAACSPTRPGARPRAGARQADARAARRSRTAGLARRRGDAQRPQRLFRGRGEQRSGVLRVAPVRGRGGQLYGGAERLRRALRSEAGGAGQSRVRVVWLRRFGSAKADLTSVNDYSLKFSVVLKDSDMEVFEARPSTRRWRTR